jgi:radical SAM protein with 4Fe4S-binding SPASM domain
MMSQEYTEPICQAVLEITNRCNLRCPHCASASGEAREGEMTLEQARDVIRDLRKLGCQELALLGGEPFLRPDWYEIASEVKAAGIELQLITNGLLVTEKLRKQILTLDPETFNVSVDGATPETYRMIRGVDGFGTCMRLLKDAVADGFQEVHAITTFNAKNLRDFDRFVELFIDTPIVWQVQMANGGGERFQNDLLMTRDDYRWLADKIAAASELRPRLRLLTMDDMGYNAMTTRYAGMCRPWHGCQAGRRVIGIRANGDVLPCLSLGSRFVFDNLFRRPLVEIWRDPASFPGFRDEPKSLTGKCRICPHAKICRAGCHAMAYSLTRTLTENPFCVRQLEADDFISEITA